MGTASDSYDETSDTISGGVASRRQYNRPTRPAADGTPQAANKGKRTPRMRKTINGDGSGRPPISSPMSEHVVQSPMSGRTGRGRATAMAPGRSSANASPVHPDVYPPEPPSSEKKRKRRRLNFGEEAMSGGQEGARPAQGAPGGRGRQDRLHGDVSEGVSALLSLAAVSDQDQQDNSEALAQTMSAPAAAHHQQPSGGGPGSSKGETPGRRREKRPVQREAPQQQPMVQQQQQLQQQGKDVDSDEDYTAPVQTPSRSRRQALSGAPPAEPDAPGYAPSPSRRDAFASPIKTNSALEPPRSRVLQSAKKGDGMQQIGSPGQAGGRAGGRGMQQIGSPAQARRGAAGQGTPSQGGLYPPTNLTAQDIQGAAAGQHALAATIIGNQNVAENQAVFWSWLNKQTGPETGAQGQAPEDSQQLGDQEGSGEGPQLMRYGRRHKRKPAPERFPFAMSAAKYAFTRSLMPAQVQRFAPAAAFSGQGQQGKSQFVGETGEPMSLAEIQLRHCLGSRTRRWCMYEFHYSALDRPWFLRNELQEFLHHLGIAHVTSLTRTEWSIIRSAFGKPRRLSHAFLQDERQKLELYREQVRKKYEDAGMGQEVPPDLPRPLRVGQEVTARHPHTRQLHDGVVLTVKSNKYRIQFQRSELMTEMVRDVDVMPVDPGENLPLTLSTLPLLLNGRMNSGATGLLPRRRGGAQLLPGRGPAAGRAMQDGRSVAEEHGRETDAKPLLDLATALDLKEGLLRSIKDLHDAAERFGPNERAEFERSCAPMMAQLKEVDQQLQEALKTLQHRPHLLEAAQKLLQSRGPQIDLPAEAVAMLSLPPARPSAPSQSQQPLPSTPQDEAVALVKSALAQARSIVEQIRVPPPALLNPPPAPPAPSAAAPADSAIPATQPTHTQPAATDSTPAAAEAAAGAHAAAEESRGADTAGDTTAAEKQEPGNEAAAAGEQIGNGRAAESGGSDKGGKDAGGGEGNGEATAADAAENGPGKEGGQGATEAGLPGNKEAAKSTESGKGDTEVVVKEELGAEEGKKSESVAEGQEGAGSKAEVGGQGEEKKGEADTGGKELLQVQKEEGAQDKGGDAAGAAPSPLAAGQPKVEPAAVPATAPGAAPGGVPGVPALTAQQRYQLLQQEESSLMDLWTGCMGMLLTVQRCMADGVGPDVISTALDLALDTLKPKSAANQDVFQNVARAVGSIKSRVVFTPAGGFVGGGPGRQ